MILEWKPDSDLFSRENSETIKTRKIRPRWRISRAAMSTPSSGPSHPTPNPPKDDPITTKELALHNGADSSKPIWVAVKGTVFDVSRNKDAYGKTPKPIGGSARESLLFYREYSWIAPGKGYNVFAGRDASKALGKSSMKPEDLSADYSELTEWELKVLDDWLAYYTKVICSPFFGVAERYWVLQLRLGDFWTSFNM
jgi:membrane-associated progesterone receptor component